MFSQLLEIEPQELKFIFELKKQSSCSVRLLNKTNNYVAFKVKTTNPKNYCVRPNTGVIEPKATCVFIVTMQAQRVAPPEMISKDKFLIQSVVVPVRTTEKMITSSLFMKDDGNYVEESKLRVILASPPHSPVLSPMNGVHNEAPALDVSILKDQNLHGVETASPQHKVTEVAESKVENGDLLAAPKTLDMGVQLAPANALDLETVQDVEEPKLVKDIENMKTQISELDFKLKEAEATISKLIEEKRVTIQEREILQQELALLRSKKGVRKVRVGFPFLYVCMIALISAVLGYLLHL